jgi:hypothetical protein
MPPCAYEVFDSSRVVLHNKATLPYDAAFKAKLMPAIPLPMTKKSNLRVIFLNLKSK